MGRILFEIKDNFSIGLKMSTRYFVFFFVSFHFLSTVFLPVWISGMSGVSGLYPLINMVARLAGIPLFACLTLSMRMSQIKPLACSSFAIFLPCWKMISIVGRRDDRYKPRISFQKSHAQMGCFYPVFHCFCSKIAILFIAHFKKIVLNFTLAPGLFHNFEHKNSKNFVRVSFHFKIPDLREQKSIRISRVPVLFFGDFFLKIPGLGGQKYSVLKGCKSLVSPSQTEGLENANTLLVTGLSVLPFAGHWSFPYCRLLFAVLCLLFSVLCLLFSVCCSLFSRIAVLPFCRSLFSVLPYSRIAVLPFAVLSLLFAVLFYFSIPQRAILTPRHQPGELSGHNPALRGSGCWAGTLR
jgi:hypothetical protein